jgi:hypothetical protein
MRTLRHWHPSRVSFYTLTSPFLATLLPSLRLPLRLPTHWVGFRVTFLPKLRAARLFLCFSLFLHPIEQNLCRPCLAKKIRPQLRRFCFGSKAGHSRILSSSMPSSVMPRVKNADDSKSVEGAVIATIPALEKLKFRLSNWSGLRLQVSPFPSCQLTPTFPFSSKAIFIARRISAGVQCEVCAAPTANKAHHISFWACWIVSRFHWSTRNKALPPRKSASFVFNFCQFPSEQSSRFHWANGITHVSFCSFVIINRIYVT